MITKNTPKTGTIKKKRLKVKEWRKITGKTLRVTIDIFDKNFKTKILLSDEKAHYLLIKGLVNQNVKQS